MHFLLQAELVCLPGILLSRFDKGTVAAAFPAIEGVGEGVADRHLLRVFRKHRCPTVNLDQRNVNSTQAEHAEGGKEEDAALEVFWHDSQRGCEKAFSRAGFVNRFAQEAGGHIEPVHGRLIFMTSHFDCIARAIDLLVERHPEVPGLDELGRLAGLSPSHFQRLFVEFVGISPKRFSQYLFLQDARERLQRGEAVLEAALGAGLSGPGRLHDLTVRSEAVTPGEARSGGRGLDIEYDWSPTPFGWGLFARTQRGLCSFSLHEAESPEAFAGLGKRFPSARLRRNDGFAETLAEKIFQAKAGGGLTLHLRGTNFQIQVWKALMEIPDGLAASYGSIARMVERPKASRAVGTAVGNNPVAILIPCHRVLRESGAIGGYRWGLGRKRALLAWERVRPPRMAGAEQ